VALKVPPGLQGVSHWWLWRYLLDDQVWATGGSEGTSWMTRREPLVALNVPPGWPHVSHRCTSR